jgi:hypothetical protein
MKADRDIYESADGQVVEADDPNAAFLVARKGIEIPEKTAARLGLGKKEKAEPAPEEPAKPASKSPAKASKGKKK